MKSHFWDENYTTFQVRGASYFAINNSAFKKESPFDHHHMYADRLHSDLKLKITFGK